MNASLRFAALFFVAHCSVIFSTAATAQSEPPAGWVTRTHPSKSSVRYMGSVCLI